MLICVLGSGFGRGNFANGTAAKVTSEPTIYCATAENEYVNESVEMNPANHFIWRSSADIIIPVPVISCACDGVKLSRWAVCVGIAAITILRACWGAMGGGSGHVIVGHVLCVTVMMYAVCVCARNFGPAACVVYVEPISQRKFLQRTLSVRRTRQRASESKQIVCGPLLMCGRVRM